MTANHRLARELREQYASGMRAKGITAWRTPRIVEVNLWLQSLRESTERELSLLIGHEHSLVLWERVLKRELGDGDANLGRLAKDARRTRERLAEYCVPVAAVGDFAFSEDQRLFAAALNRYLQLLSRHGWTDQSGMIDDVLAMLREGLVTVPKMACFAGFVNRTPRLSTLFAALDDHNCAVSLPTLDASPRVETARFVSDAEEFRAAGRWARTLVDENPNARIGIVVPNLEDQVDEAGQQVREGFCPGWQIEPRKTGRLVNVSYGRRMLEYPAIQTAIMSLRWMTGSMAAPDIGILLRSDCIGEHDDDSRTACDIALRDAPVRDWSVAEFSQEYAREDNALSVLLKSMQAGRDAISTERGSPAIFAGLFDVALKCVGWPGNHALSSNEFQLVNRWREALNQLASLSFIEPKVTAAAGLSRLNAVLSEAVFQPESLRQGIDVLGPLEAAGMEFDALWITGMSAEQWPGSRRPDPLLARELQIKHNMPDATPEEVRATSQRLFLALSKSSHTAVLSFSQFEGDAEHNPSPMLPTPTVWTDFEVPKRFAESSYGSSAVAIVAKDAVPPVVPGERVFGGASIIDRQASSPFDAFTLSRLGVQPIWPFSFAFSAKDRGILMHDALAHFYSVGLGTADLCLWSQDDARSRATTACQKTFQSAFRGKSNVQANILRFEEARMVRLLLKVWEHDCARQPGFQIAQLEERQSLTIKSLRIYLQADRIDQCSDGGLHVLDYKTGSEKRLLSKGELTSFQLVLYAMLVSEKVSGIGLYNVNANGIKIHGAGAGLSKKAELFAESFSEWQATALAHADNIVAGDVRVLAQQSTRDSRRTALLSRVAELKRDG